MKQRSKRKERREGRRKKRTGKRKRWEGRRNKGKLPRLEKTKLISTCRQHDVIYKSDIR